MEIETFKEKLVVLDKTERRVIREKYIKKFINTNHELYQEQIRTKYKFIDGYCYLGYLWDYLKDSSVIEKDYMDVVAASIDEIYVFWDIHSCERIFIENYWRFDKDAVLKLDLKTLLLCEEYLPEDIYIFDESFRWTLVKTHEYIDGKCFCLKSGKI